MPDQPQQQPPQHQDRQPGTEGNMTPRPRAEMENYVGSGKLTDKVAIVTGRRTAASDAPSPSASPRKARTC